jgi:hypothetical protein
MALAIVHVILGLIAIGYAQNYYFHLRKFRRLDLPGHALADYLGHHKNNAH